MAEWSVGGGCMDCCFVCSNEHPASVCQDTEGAKLKGEALNLPHSYSPLQPGDLDHYKKSEISDTNTNTAETSSQLWTRCEKHEALREARSAPPHPNGVRWSGLGIWLGLLQEIQADPELAAGTVKPFWLRTFPDSSAGAGRVPRHSDVCPPSGFVAFFDPISDQQKMGIDW